MSDKTANKLSFIKSKWIIVVLLFSLCTPWNTVPAFAIDKGEYAVKAAFVLNFALLTEWPKQSFADESSPIKLCVLGNKHLIQAFASLDGKKVGKRTIKITTTPPHDAQSYCHIIFFGKDENTKIVLRTLNNVSRAPVLTIGEKETFIDFGGVIRFFMERERLRFEIKPAAAEKQGLHLSSRLLKIAILADE